MSDSPPPYASYPRDATVFGSSRDLQSLFQGYNGLTVAFLVNIALVVPLNVLSRLHLLPRPLFGLGVLIVFAVVFAMTLGPNRKIGEGAHWQPWQPLLATFLIALNSAVCCGIIGYLVMQTIATNHIKKYGLRNAKKSAVNARIAELQAMERR